MIIIICHKSTIISQNIIYKLYITKNYTERILDLLGLLLLSSYDYNLFQLQTSSSGNVKLLNNILLKYNLSNKDNHLIPIISKFLVYFTT